MPFSPLIRVTFPKRKYMIKDLLENSQIYPGNSCIRKSCLRIGSIKKNENSLCFDWKQKYFLFTAPVCVWNFIPYWNNISIVKTYSIYFLHRSMFPEYYIQCVLVILYFSSEFMNTLFQHHSSKCFIFSWTLSLMTLLAYQNY